MDVYNIAGLTVSYNSKYDKLKKRSIPYLANEGTVAKYVIRLDYDELEKSLPQYPLLDIAALEYMRVGSYFYTALIGNGGFLLHASAVVVDGVAYCFSAPSGTGKSTHTNLWLEVFKNKGAYIINDDKPAVKIVDGVPIVYGTPFSGKHDISVNTCVPLKALCFIQRSDINSIKKISAIQAASLVLDQTIRPENDELMDRLFDTLEKVVLSVPSYILSCNISKEAAVLAYNEMSGE